MNSKPKPEPAAAIQAAAEGGDIENQRGTTRYKRRQLPSKFFYFNFKQLFCFIVTEKEKKD